MLSDRNRTLLATLREAQPRSLAELAELTGRKKSNLSRTLTTMERYGIVRLAREGKDGHVVAKVPFERIRAESPLDVLTR